MTTKSTRPGGRSAVVVAAVKAAVEDLIEERGRAAITIPMVAERAGVNPTSVYRRWGDVQTMVNDIATYRLDPNRPLPDTSDLRKDLELWAGEIVAHYSDPVNAALLRAGAGSAGEVENDCLRNRRVEAGLLVGRAPEGSGLDPEELIDFVIAPIIYRIIFSPWTLDETTAPRLVGRLFDRAAANAA